jgi:hypothetical protein
MTSHYVFILCILCKERIIKVYNKDVLSGDSFIMRVGHSFKETVFFALSLLLKINTYEYKT